MAIPESYMAFRRAPGENAEVILPTIERIPSLKPTDVLIRVHAVSLNYRDVGMLHGKYPGLVKDQGVPASDCAGEVVDLGSAVTQVSLGDRVSPIFDLRYIEMPNPESKVAQLGGNVDGVLRQYAVFDESVLIRIPPHLSWEEAACITCAGTTAWNSLEMNENNGHEKSALMLGTGGVNEKLRNIATLGPYGAINTINYRTNPDWEQEVSRLTAGRGVDYVLETVGSASIQKSITSLTTRGTISWIGFLGGLQLDDIAKSLGQLFLKVGTLKAIQVGSKKDQQDLCRFLKQKKVSLKSIIGKKFHFEESPEAFDYLYSGKCVGKVVIIISH
ncbi:hypothetical protein ACSS6W_011094 [Trichoderma asperelloides]